MGTFTLGKSRGQVLDMIPEWTINKIHVGEQVIALVRIDVNFHAFQTECPHRGTSLIHGSLTDDCEIICPLHYYRFDLKTVAGKVGSCGDLKIYDTELTDEGLKIFILSV
ncbi:nitrite reductase/ring-hydroxylating ferredoxin subunit [Algoriphagus ratkowskyi]|uniref:Nitrite reductase/ring-hydroxylating ferredoxin subunit n=1 Tax=Algoriphagus ratkowskyi TaxID=57028 RepID=A0A2W7RHR8_9BACT|nr:Rieske (2Fe-2S) protein [Algoriphagus ratkowskyi]PZX59771.1 nitrite reductase/ring-hydroxylating ferredoxin subunit [Algoriphagus ratkowskyi]TXD78518.1 Rieske 2Fe-2S domain-containing protein [Algoriphagus ratkowskyi]